MENGFDPKALIKKANQNQRIERKLTIQIPDGSGKTPLNLLLRSSDIFEIMNDWGTIRAAEYATCVEYGLKGKPINEELWEKNKKAALKDATTKEERKIVEDQKPFDMAEQEAEQRTRRKAIQTLIPKIVRDQRTEQFLFDTFESQRDFGEFIINNSEILELVADAYVSLMLELNKVRQEVKNLSGGKKANSKSNASLPAN